MSTTAVEVFQMRAMAHDDIDRIVDWFSDFDDVALYERPFPVPIGREALKQHWLNLIATNDPPSALWFIVDDPSGDPAGFCGLESINYVHGDAVVPVFVRSSERGKGLALALGGEVVDLAFSKLRLHRLTTYYRADNTTTAAIVEKLGFQIEGRRREAWYSDDQHRDLIQVGLLHSEWTERRAAFREALTKSARISINKRLSSE